MLDFGCRVMNSEFLVSGFRLKASKFGSRVFGSAYQPRSNCLTASIIGCLVWGVEGFKEGRCKAYWKREFKLLWHEAGPPNHHDDQVDLD